MKQTLSFLASLLLAVALPHSAKAYDFSAVAPSGQTLYFNIVTGGVEVTSENGDWNGYTTYPTGALTIPSSVTYGGTTYAVTSIGDLAFYNCSGLTSVTIPDSVTSIGDYAFSGCSGLTSVTIGNGVTSIGEGAFYGCSGLTSVTIPDGVTSIGNNVFSGCSGLTSVTIPSGVTSIGNYAFRNCSGLTSVTIPDGVTSIGWYAFYNCSGLTSVTIPDGVTLIGDYAFYNCSGLTSVTIGSGVTSIGDYAFYFCSGLTSVIIPDGVTSIGDYAFCFCRGLTSVIIPDGVTSIGNSAFYGCSELTSTIYNGTIAQWCSITFGNSESNPINYSHNLTIGDSNITNLVIPENVTEISPYAFYSCSGLTSATIGSGITSIGNEAFWGCGGLTSVTIPDGVTSIGYSAFEGCSGLNEITCLSSVAPLLGDSAFNGVSTSIPINIPCGSSMSYYSRWSYFSNFVEAAAFTFSATTADSTMGSVVVLTQPTCTAPTAVINAVAGNGYRFLRWSNGVTDNPYSLTVTADTTLTAFFTTTDTPRDTVYIYIHDTIVIHDTIYITQEGIDGIGVVNAKVYQHNGNIVVEGADGNTVMLYDVTGRVLATKQDDYTQLRFDAPASGTYLIKIGALPARRVVVIR